MRYLVTTKVDSIPLDHQIIMVDGTVPGWEAKPGDLHWDHHRAGGADIQIDEMPMPKVESSRDSETARTLLEQCSTGQPPCFVTTMVDADACCAAAWVQLPASAFTPDTVMKLRAIAWDCDHLVVPQQLNQWAEFAAKAVAALKHTGHATTKELRLPENRQQWTEKQWQEFSSAAFKQGTEWLIAAAQGQRPYPGEQGEADQYWQEVQADTKKLLAEQRLHLIATANLPMAVFDLHGIGHAVDPRAALAALTTNYTITDLRPETLTIREHRQGGTQYTLGCIPLHPDTKKINYTAGIFDRLTAAERAINPNADSWGGRRTVGGSPWNTPSQLSPEAVVRLIDSS